MHVVDVQLLNVASGDADSLLAELLPLIESLPFPIWRGRAKKAKHIGVIPVLNAMFRVKLQALQWRLGPRLVNGDVPDAMKTFCGQRVTLEVQFGNTSRAAEDVLKFMALADAKAADMFVHIAYDSGTANVCADGVATGDHFRALVRQAGWRYADVPTVAITISQEGESRVDVATLGIPVEALEQGRNPQLADEIAATLIAGERILPSRRVRPAVQADLFC